MSKEIPLKMIVDAVSNQKGISEDIIFDTLEAALVSATKKKHGSDIDVRVTIDRKTGKYFTYREWTVIDDPKNFEPMESPLTQITLSAARLDNPNIQVGDKIEEEMESVDFGRIAAQTAKQVIIQNVRLAEKDLVAKEFSNKIGSLVTGVVKKIIRDGIVVDLGGNAEGILLKEHMLPKESFRPGDRVKSHLYEVINNIKGPQMYLSRANNGMLIELFKIEVPEISEGIIEIKSVAREPGVRAKIAVKTNDGRIDPIGASVGMRGSRVQAVSNELGGERIDIVLWSDDTVQFVMNAMAPAEVVSIVIDEETKVIDIAVKDEYLPQAIGKNGQNIILASMLTGWELNVIGSTEAIDKNANEVARLKDIFMSKLQVDEDLAQVLVNEGFASIEEIAYVPVQELLDIDGFDEEIVKKLRNIAKNVLLSDSSNLNNNSDDNSDNNASLDSLEGMTKELLVKLKQNNILTRDDFAELSVDDLLEICDIDQNDAAKLIMSARAHWFKEA
jgi:transcription termination/antitermination protein NusA